MRDNPYKDLPPLERKPDGSLYRMTPAQKKQAASLIRRECCCFEDGNCVVLDDGDTCTCPQTVSFSVCCKWFRWAVLPLYGTLEAEIFRDKDLKRCAVCGGVLDVYKRQVVHHAVDVHAVWVILRKTVGYAIVGIFPARNAVRREQHRNAIGIGVIQQHLRARRGAQNIQCFPARMAVGEFQNICAQ